MNHLHTQVGITKDILVLMKVGRIDLVFNRRVTHLKTTGLGYGEITTSVLIFKLKVNQCTRLVFFMLKQRIMMTIRSQLDANGLGLRMKSFIKSLRFKAMFISYLPRILVA